MAAHRGRSPGPTTYEMLESVEAAVVDMQSRLVKLEDLLEELREREGPRDENRTRTGHF
jgi:hypothetical protein